MRPLRRSFFLPARWKICDLDLAHHVAEPWGGFHSCRGCCLLNSLVEFRFNVEIEVAHRAVYLALVEGLCLLTAQTPVHDPTQHRSARPVEVLSEVIHFLARRRVQAGIH